jgi:hypothetical protein
MYVRWIPLQDFFRASLVSHGISIEFFLHEDANGQNIRPLQLVRKNEERAKARPYIGNV